MFVDGLLDPAGRKVGWPGPNKDPSLLFSTTTNTHQLHRGTSVPCFVLPLCPQESKSLGLGLIQMCSILMRQQDDICKLAVAYLYQVEGSPFDSDAIRSPILFMWAMGLCRNCIFRDNAEEGPQNL